MIEKKYSILGNNYLFLMEEDIYCSTICEEFKYYPSWQETTDFITVKINSSDLNITNFYRNPKNHYYSNEIMGIDFGWGKVFWDFDKHIIYVNFDDKENDWISKFRDIQFCKSFEWAGQRLHEDVLIGTVLFEKDKFVVHGSAVSNRDGKVVIIGGTGGTGKTSTLISIGKEDGVYFVCDDMCSIRNDGKVFPNFAYPKIYAYNVLGNKKFENRILKSGGVTGQIQWNIKKATRGLSSVRRRVDPSVLYNIPSSKITNNFRLGTYIFLNRTDFCSDMSVENVTKEDAIEMNTMIMKNELSKFYLPLEMRKLNSLYAHRYSSTGDNYFDNWKKSMFEALKNVKILQINIPYHYDNELLKEKMRLIILEELER